MILHSLTQEITEGICVLASLLKVTLTLSHLSFRTFDFFCFQAERVAKLFQVHI